MGVFAMPQKLLTFLREIYETQVCRRNFLGQTTGAKDLASYSMRLPGFPNKDHIPRQRTLTFGPNACVMETKMKLFLFGCMKALDFASVDQLSKMEKKLSCLRFLATFLKSQQHAFQPAHTNIKKRTMERVLGRSRKKHYGSCLVFFPLTTEGMELELWNRDGKERQGRKLQIPYGTMLMLRGDMLHADGGLCGQWKTSKGNPRMMLCVHKPMGAPPLTNAEQEYQQCFAHNGVDTFDPRKFLETDGENIEAVATTRDATMDAAKEEEEDEQEVEATEDVEALSSLPLLAHHASRRLLLDRQSTTFEPR